MYLAIISCCSGWKLVCVCHAGDGERSDVGRTGGSDSVQTRSGTSRSDSWNVVEQTSSMLVVAFTHQSLLTSMSSSVIICCLDLRKLLMTFTVLVYSISNNKRLLWLRPFFQYHHLSKSFFPLPLQSNQFLSLGSNAGSLIAFRTKPHVMHPKSILVHFEPQKHFWWQKVTGTYDETARFHWPGTRSPISPPPVNSGCESGGGGSDKRHDMMENLLRIWKHFSRIRYNTAYALCSERWGWQPALLCMFGRRFQKHIVVYVGVTGKSERDWRLAETTAGPITRLCATRWPANVAEIRQPLPSQW